MSRRSVAILLILAVAATLRLHGITRSIWFDEAATIHIVRQPLAQMIDSIKSDERTPPLHYLILHVWVKMFGDSEASVRMPSVIAGVAAVWVLYLLTRRLLSELAALAAAIMMATSPYQIVYSQEARAYMLMVCLGLLSCDLFVRLCERRTSRIESAYIIITAALLYAHLYGVYVLAAQHVAYAFWRPRKMVPVRRWLLLNLGVLLLFSPWLATAIRWTRSAQASFWISLPPATPNDITAAFRVYAGSAPLLVLLATLAVIGVWRAVPKRGLPLLSALAILPVALPVALGMLTHATFIPRYGIIAAPALFALAGAGVAALRFNVLRGVCIAAIVLLAATTSHAAAPTPDWREIVRYLSDHARPADIIVLNRKNSTYLYDFYVRRSDIRRIGFDGPAIPLTLPLDPGRRVWLVFNGDDRLLNQILARGPWRVLSHKRFADVLVLELTDELAERAIGVTSMPSSANHAPTPSP